MASPNRHRYTRIEPERIDNRSAGQRDRDRILYSSAFHRLVEVTQVVPPEEGHVFHNRLTHSLKVAQVARRIAEKLKATSGRSPLLLDPDVVEAAALAHDLGHPPFGHIAEEELNRLVTNTYHVPDGFNGNAQSFRIITRLALRCEDYRGLNLTRATLNAVLKYPWQRTQNDGIKWKKWGAYSTEDRAFAFAREGFEGRADDKCLEAEIMDLADDITYAVHDLSDFFRAGLIPLHRFAEQRRHEADRFLEDVFQNEAELALQKRECRKVLRNWTTTLPFNHAYSDTESDRSTLRNFTSGLIGTYIRLSTRLSRGRQRHLVVEPPTRLQLDLLKQLTWHYVIRNPALATQQYGQKQIIEKLFDTFLKAAEGNNYLIFPMAFREMLKRATGNAGRHEFHTRIVCDYIAGLTERQALALHLKLTGERPGSAIH